MIDLGRGKKKINPQTSNAREHSLRTKGIITCVGRKSKCLLWKYGTFGLVYGSIFSHHFQLLIASKHISAKICYFHWFRFSCPLPSFECEYLVNLVRNERIHRYRCCLNALNIDTEYYGENCEKRSYACSMCFDHLTITQSVLFGLPFLLYIYLKYLTRGPNNITHKQWN